MTLFVAGSSRPARATLCFARRIAGVILLLTALSSFSAEAQGVGYWHTSGNQVLDSNGNVVRIAGVNWYGFETTDYLAHGLWAQDYKTILNTIKSLGYNVIRVPFSNQMVESDPVPSNFTSYANGQPANTVLSGQTALQDLDTIVSYAGSIGLRVILDNHRSEAGNSNESNGLWYTGAYPQSNWLADWKTLATRYSDPKFTFNGNPTVIGMDLRNEPFLLANGNSGACWTGDTTVSGGCPISLTSRNWPVAAQTAGNAVLAINPNLLIVVEGVDCYSGVCGWQGGNLIGAGSNPVALSVPNQLVYSAHDYGPNLYGQSWFNSGTTQASLYAVWNKYWGYLSTNGTAPVWLGEFGTDDNIADIESANSGSQGQWFESLIAYLQANPHVQWTYWALNGEDYYGLLDSNYDAAPANAQKQAMLQSIQSPLSGGQTCSATPAAPGGLTASGVSSSGINLGWTAVAPPAGCTITSYDVYRSANSGFTPASSNLVAAVSGTSFSDSGLAASTTYYYAVEAVDAHGSSAPSSHASATTQAAPVCSAVPAAPSGLSAAAVSSSAINLSWNSVAPPANCKSVTYDAYRSTTAGFAPSAANQIAGGLSSASFSSTGLSPSTTYYFRVTAQDSAGPSAPSSQASASTPSASSGFSCHVSYNIVGQWPGGFEAILVLNNTGPTAINQWDLTWTFANGQSIYNLWTGAVTQNGANVSVQNLSYDGTIPAGGSYSGLGFLATWNNSVNSVPASFAINGTVCK